MAKNALGKCIFCVLALACCLTQLLSRGSGCLYVCGCVHVRERGTGDVTRSGTDEDEENYKKKKIYTMSGCD